MELETKEVTHKMSAGGGGLPPVPPGMNANPQMMAMMQMLMQAQNNSVNFQENFTNIEEEFYETVVGDGLLVADKNFMTTVLEECKEEAFDVIIRKSFMQLGDLKDLKTLNIALSIVNVIAR